MTCSINYPEASTLRGGKPTKNVSSASDDSSTHETLFLASYLVEGPNLGLVILRPTMIYGSSGDKNVRLFARLVARLPVVPRLVGGGSIQPILADDVASAVATTLGTTRRIEADLGGPVAIRLGELVSELALLLDIDKRVVPRADSRSGACLVRRHHVPSSVVTRPSCCCDAPP
jgi:uncharacterized protein YbjT (DUF2867 family)